MVYTNDISKHTVVIGGFPIEGFLTEDKTMWELDGDESTSAIGADGFSTINRVFVNASFSVTLASGSPSVTVLNALFPTPASSKPFQLKNGSNGSTVNGVASLKKRPAFGLKTTDDGYTFEFIATDNVLNVKGV